MFFLSLLPVFILALVALANPVVTTIRDSTISLPIARRVRLASGKTLYEHDYARAQALKARSKVGSVSKLANTPAENRAVSYISKVGVGSPATQYNLIVDTGSSNTWIGAGTKYSPTHTSQKTPNTVGATYGSGFFSGTEYIDTITLGSGLVIPTQSIGVASTAAGFDGTDGILGIGPVALTRNTLSPDTNATIPTVIDNLFSRRTISSKVIGIFFEPTNSNSTVNGVLTWGGTDRSKFTGSITYTPITVTEPAKLYWGIDQTVTYGKSKTPILAKTAGIVDTGTTLVLISKDAYDKYQTVTGATFDAVAGLLKITSAQYAKLQSLYFWIGGKTFEFTANAQIWPRSLNTAIGGSTGDIYLVVGNLGSSTGQGLDFINGQTWLERFYSVYDTDKERVGIATTPFTRATSN